MSMKMTMAEFVGLEPCPFCGGEAETFNPFPNVEGTWCVLCSECAAATGFEQTEAEAIAAWNTRVELGSEINGETSDGYHTFNELYHHRAVLFSVVVAANSGRAWKSKLHHDGTMYDGMFIVGVDTPQGQATYHYDVEPYWDMFWCRELERAPEWDGHTPDEAIVRIAELGSVTCEIIATATNNLMYPDYMTKWYELSCGHSLTLKGDEAPKWCAVCGAKVIQGVDNAD